MTEFKNSSPIGNQLINALVSFLVVAVVYFPFVLPWMLWVKSVKHLSDLHDEKGILKTLSESKTSFFTWFSYFLDALSFFSYIAGPVIIIIMSNNHGMSGFIKFSLFFYFIPVFLHFIKELILVLINPSKQ